METERDIQTDLSEENMQWKLLFDGECPYCIKFAGLVKKFDPADKIYALSLQEYFSKNKNIPLEELLSEVHIISENNIVLKGSDAVNMILSIIPHAAPARWMIESRWGKKSTDLLYRTVKKFRRCSSCGK